MSLSEDQMHRVVFVRPREEGGINSIYDPISGKEIFQVFIHNPLPYCEIGSWNFESFNEARSFAAKQFNDWEMLTWDMKTKRPCEEGGKECGSGECDTCKSVKADPGAVDTYSAAGSSCGSCGGA